MTDRLGGLAAPALRRPPALAAADRIAAMILRHWHLLRASGMRILELAFWPVLNMMVWGLTSKFFLSNSSYLVQAAGVLLAAVLLWEVVLRGQIGLSLTFLDEVWSRNLGQLFVTPLRPGEWIASLMAMSLLRTLIGIAIAAILALLMYGFSLLELGLPLIGYFLALIVMGWAIGLVMCGLVLRHGLAAETLVWAAAFALSPLSCVYYPITTLPEWLRPVALALPSTHVFEGMRAILFDHRFDANGLIDAIALDALYLALGVAAFLRFFQRARIEGKLLQVGE